MRYATQLILLNKNSEMINFIVFIFVYIRVFGNVYTCYEVLMNKTSREIWGVILILLLFFNLLFVHFVLHYKSEQMKQQPILLYFSPTEI